MNITLKELKNLKDYLLIDVREINEYNEYHLPNAICVPLSLLPLKIEELFRYKEKNIVLYCKSGNRSNQALQYFKKYKFSNVYDFGSIDNWK